MKILLCNDDGIYSSGIIKLAERLSCDNEVMVVAPNKNRSACSHSLSINKPIKITEIKEFEKFKAYSISGTPCDCVKIAKLKFSNFNADIVVSGINKEHNLGSDILYSGTVAIACEAAYFGNISFAFSAFNRDDNDFIVYSDYAVKIIDLLLPLSNRGDIWNINFPNVDVSKIKGLKITQLGKQIYSDRYEKVTENEYKLVGELVEHNENDSDCDIEWIKKGYITVTPILFNKTNYKKIKKIGNLII